MDVKEPNFFRLNYLCFNKIGQMASQSVIIRKNISNPKGIQRVKSGTTQISKKILNPKFTKIEKPKSLLKDNNLNNYTNNLLRTKSNNRKVLNRKYQSYYIDNNTVH
jgi:hypothetical protein